MTVFNNSYCLVEPGWVTWHSSAIAYDVYTSKQSLQVINTQYIDENKYVNSYPHSPLVFSVVELSGGAYLTLRNVTPKHLVLY